MKIFLGALTGVVAAAIGLFIYRSLWSERIEAVEWVIALGCGLVAGILNMLQFNRRNKQDEP
jgi:hypothetical protein